ncbi:hypothetical protein DSCA_55370 [Desulfosarcina alkanivorans]|jgi:hypothetical protein|uniref:Uncharacterized protein n=1 Tax=Desulfosarcina alkanivorans TaxID=571177 RepID=A0A5K7Z4Q2_9BACT|nr:hypothetical protein DSCA_55370 [Desulfosarcina alkanivorans]
MVASLAEQSVFHCFSHQAFTDRRQGDAVTGFHKIMGSGMKNSGTTQGKPNPPGRKFKFSVFPDT